METVVSKNDTNVYADLADVTVLEAPEANQIPTGYEFTEWSYDGKPYKPGDVFTLDAANATTGTDTIAVREKDVNYVTLTAQYTKLDTTYIHYNQNGGTGTLTDGVDAGSVTNYKSDIPFNSTTELSSGAGFTRAGYVLIGWNTDQEAASAGTVEWKLSEKVGVDDKSGNELYAVWAPVIFDLDLTKYAVDSDGSSNKAALKNVEFTITGQTGGQTYTATSNDSGTVSFKDVIPGNVDSLILTETVPANYENVNGPYTITWTAVKDSSSNDYTYRTLTTNGVDTKYIVVTPVVKDANGTEVGNKEILNKRKTVDITIKKEDQKGGSLNGAEFKIVKAGTSEAPTASGIENGGVIKITSDGQISITGLQVGSYTLKETKAPDGYIILNSDVTFTVSNTGITLAEGTSSDLAEVSGMTLTVKNTPGKELPSTGGSGTLLYTIGGLAIISMAAYMYVYLLRRNKQFKG